MNMKWIESYCSSDQALHHLAMQAVATRWARTNCMRNLHNGKYQPSSSVLILHTQKAKEAVLQHLNFWSTID